MAFRLPDCVFCERISQRRSDVAWDQALAENDQYIVVPTKGSLVPGCLLVVSKDHALCAGAMKDQEPNQFSSALKIASTLLERAFGPVTLFEHGPVTEGTALGCGIDHLHIHVAHLQFSMQTAFQALYPDSEWTLLDSWTDLQSIHAERTPYIAIQEPGRQLQWCRAPLGVRQPLRRAIATAIGAGPRFDYNEHPNPENVARTLELLAAT